MLSDEQRRRTLERFEELRRGWERNAPLRELYAEWYALLRAELPPQERGPWVEIGSGPGIAREHIPEMELTDLVKAPWHAREASADALPFADASVGALVLFDVLHHLAAPAGFLAEAERVLVAGGRIVLCEPYVSPLSYPVYRWLHPEGAHIAVAPLELVHDPHKDPFASNQAIPTVLFGRGRRELETRFPGLRVVKLQRLSGPSYPATGGFFRQPLVPETLWRALRAVEAHLPAAAFRLLGFRMIVVVERTARP